MSNPHRAIQTMTSTAPTYLIDDALWSRTLTLDIARELNDQTFDFFYGDQNGQTHVAPLRVTDFKERSQAGNNMQQYNVSFLGPGAPLLPSQAYRARHNELGDFVIFISATSQSEEGTTYQAIFSHAA